VVPLAIIKNNSDALIVLEATSIVTAVMAVEKLPANIAVNY